MQKIHYTPKGADILYYPYFLSETLANSYFEVLFESLQWEQFSVKIFGKTIPQPRLSALYAKNHTQYTYSGLTITPLEFTEELYALQEKIKKICEVDFTHCLANLYRNGNDSMGWHSDDEKVLGKNPIIASLSFGAARKFMLKHKTLPHLKEEIVLNNGSLLVMQGETQHFWKHQLPKSKKINTPRINLTFRKIF